jgi:hypothetical protein
VIRGVPVVKNRLNITVIISKNTIAFIPLTMNLKGTFESFITINKNNAATAYPAIPLKMKSEIINNKVVPNLTLGSNRCIQESV